MRKIVTILVFALTVHVSAALADSAPWGPVTGRASQVALTFRPFSSPSVAISIDSFVPEVSSQEYEIKANCGGSTDYECASLASGDNYPVPCAWTALSVSQRSAITYLIGGAWCGSQGHPICTYETVGDQAIHIDHWSCQGGPHAANCLSMSGTLTPTLRIDSVTQASSCSF